MKYNIKDFNDGWFIGDFQKSILDTKDFEVAWKFHNAGDKHATHYHSFVTEFILVTSGKIIINDVELNPGEIFKIEPNKITYITYIDDSKLIIIKSPSIPKDKIMV